jgi:hypothetical protein
MALSKKIPTEEEDQKALVAWLKMLPVLFFAIPNDNKTSFLDRRKSIVSELRAQSLGKSPGVPDLVIMAKNKLPLFLEMKRLKGGRLSEAQKKWHQDLEEYGHIVRTAKGFGEAVDIVKKYLQGKL